MADFGGFEIEDDEKKPSSPSAFGGFEIEDGDEGASGETGSAAPAKPSTPKSPAPTSASPAPATEAPPAPTWESGDGGEPTLPVGEKNQWGGNLRTEGRKPLIRRDANGKVSGYSTTTSMGLTLPDGRIAVVPTVVDGVELSTKDAAKHYADTGEYWGMADDEEGAKKIANAVHDEHQKAYQKGWNNYIQDHWDDMGDEIRRDPGVRGERARRKRDARLAKEMEAWGKDVDVIKGYRERTKTTQVAPELFLTGDVLEDADGNAIKPGDAIAVYHKEGDGPFTGEAGQAARLMEFIGVSDDGKPVFKETEGVSSEGAMVAGKLHVRDEDFDRMMGKGEGKAERSLFEQVRNDALADTGDVYRYTDDARGTFNAFYDYLMPFLGGSAKKEHEERTRILSDIREGRLDGYDGDTDAAKLRDAARKAKLEPWNPLESLHPGESDKDFAQRIRQEAEDELKLGAAAKGRAEQARQQTEATVGDKILKGGIESGAFWLQFAIPGSIMFKGLSSMGMGIKAVRALTTLGSAIPATIVEADKRYSENITPEYGWKQTSLDGEPEFGMVAAPDAPGEAAYKAIGGAAFDTGVEVGLEAATMGLLRLAGKPAGWLLGKATPGAVKEWGAKRFNKFMASETGQALRSINRAYQDFTLKTGINNPGWEWGEENVQAFEKFLNLDGKTSEHKGFAQEWQDFKDNQLNWKTQWDIFYGLVAQLAIGSAKSAEQGIAQHISSTDARRDIRMALKRSGISDETISTLTPKQQKTLDRMWRHYSSNPDELKAKVKNLGISMRLAADELLSRESSKMAADLKRSGIEPEKFVIQTGEDGKPAFQQMMRFGSDGSKVPMNAMTDAAHGVTIVDQGNGTFHVMNDWRGLDAVPAYSFEEAQKKADEEVLRNQRKEADNKIAAQRLMELTDPENGPYRGRKVVSIPSEAALRWQIADALRRKTPILGITRADQLFKADGSLIQPGAGGFHTPDGHIVVILDNVPSPAEMERVLAHEATGHEGVESATGRGANTVEFIQNAQAEGFSKFVLAEQRRAIQKFVAAGMDEATARMQVAAAMSTDEYAREAMARYAQGRLHQPTWYERRKHELNQRRRDAGENVPTDQADLEVMLADAEKQGAQGANELETLPGDSGVRYEEGATDEARNGADEAQPQQADENAGRDGQQPPPQAAEGPVEVAPPRAEAPDAGVVEPSKSDNGGQNLNTSERPVPADTIVGDAERQPMSESSFWNVMHRKGERRRVPVDEIKIPDTQFKENADPKTGVVKGQELGEYYENAENPIAIYERKDGTMEIVTGRHRLDAAKRSGWKDIDARIFRESDGYTPEDMRLYDAVANILDEKGTVKDYVRFFDESGFSEEDAKSSGILNRQKGRMAFGIVQNATDDTRGAIDWEGTGGDGLISAEQAAIIADAAPKQAALQRILVRRALDGVRGKKLAILARSLAEEAKNRKNAPKAENGTQLDLFTSEEDVALLQQEEKRADYRAKKANEYKRIAENLRTAMRKGGRLDLNKDYAKELGISDPKDKAQLAAARDKAVERANYWENAIRLDDADKAQMDADLGIAPQLSLESVTAEQITAEERKRREKEAIKKRQEAPLKGSGAVNVQPEMDLGQTGQQDLFSPIAEKPAAEPPKTVPASAQKPETPKNGTYFTLHGNETVRVDSVDDTHVWYSYVGGVLDGGKNEMTIPAWNRLLGNGELVETKPPAAEPAENATVSAPRADGATTPPKSADAPQGGKSTENATPAAKPTAARPVSPVSTGEKPKKPSFRRGDRVFLKGAAENQRVTFLKANADGTADVQVRTPGANRYAPEKVETRTVPMGDISATGMEEVLTEAERKRLDEGIKKQQTIVMPNAAAAKEVRDAFDAIDFDTPELSSDGGRFLEWASKWKLDPSKKKNQREWVQKNHVNFDTLNEVDFEKFGRLVTGVGNLVDKLTKYGYKDFKSLATYIYEQDAAKYGRAKPVLQDVWNAVARARGLARVSDAQADEVYAAIERPQEAAPAPEAYKAPPANKLKETRISDAAEEIIKEINNLALQGKVLTRKRLTEIVENQLGGKVANGDIEAKQVTDILELAVNRHLKASWFAPKGNAEAAVLTIHNLREYLKLIPTQTTRSVEQDKMQQFSTPPTEAFAAAWVANMNDGDVMLEPSAGIGGLAVFGANAGAKVITNELSPRRAEILEQLGLGKPFEFNAENLYALLEPDIKAGKLKRPTVVVMNPPFSNSQRTDKKNTHIGADHVEQALKLLAPGGRLVAIVGNGMAHGKPAFKAWWDRIGREYTVRANVGINGQEYAKYGTTFDNNIIVIDKVAPNGSIAPIYGTIESLDELPALLEGVRNDRPIVQSDNRSKLDADRQSGDRGVEGLPGRGVHSTPAGRDAQVLPERHQQAGSDRAAGVQDSGRGPNAAGRGGGGLARPGQGAGRRLGPQDNGVPVGRGTGRREDAGGNGREDANALDSGSVAGGGILQPDAERGDLRGLEVQSVAQVREIADGTFSEYRPSKISIPGMKPHPTALVESSAMASVQPPNPTYSPKIPKKIIEDGVLSEAQIEQVIYAGQAHEQMLGNGERKGYFIGDGTGVGKGREISGIILDNFNNGRRKAVWVSEKSKLFNDAKRDLSPFGLGDEVFTLESKNLKKFGARAHGVAFTTYDSLATYHAGVDPSGAIRADPRAKGGSRMQLLAKWLGKDFDGVIVFDESHNAANAVAKKGKRGMTKPSAKALAVVDLQNLLPKARIVYVSATGATEVSNLAYAMRLGLWGKGTAFKDRDAFINQVSAGGLSVMEIVARDMKAMGVYMARTLSYEGIENERVTHELSPDQVKQYNLLADTWQMVFGEVENALISSNGIKSGQRVSNVKGAFWGAHQRFFNQILTTMQMPSVLTKAREAWDAGYSPVFQLVNTNESTQKKAIEKARKSGDDDIENLDLSPREILIGYVEQSFPTVQYVEEQTDGGKTEWRPLPDGNGGFVHDPAAVERKERLIGRLQRMKIGESPLDMILNEFGHENVAEITGRTSRREMVRNADGEMEMKLVNRSEKKRQQEIVDFQDGKRTVLVFSDAGGTGASYHADRNFKNQRRRMHFLIQPGYNAAKAIQGLGRTHRSNESSHPLYELCSTNLPGHKRFMSTIARRLAQLGSLTSGDRSSSGSGVFSEADNLENQYAKDAVLSIFEEMFMEDQAKFNRICTEMGFMKAHINSQTGEREYINTLLDEEGQFDAADRLDIPHFLNRILAMKIDAQNELFDEFSRRMAEDIERAKENGTFDPGMEKLKGITVEVKNRTRLWEDAQKIGSTDIVEVGVTKKSRKTGYAKAKSQLEYYAAAGAAPRVYTHNGSGDVLMMVETKQTKTMKDGSIVSLFRRLKPNGEVDYTTETAVEKNYTQVLRDEEGVWTRAYEATPDLIEQSRFFANGTLLPIWDRLGATNPRFFKVAPTGGAETQTFLGMEIAPENVESVLARFGKSVGAVEVTPDVQLRRVMKDGKRVELQNGWTLKRVKVLGDNRIEIDGVDEDSDVLRLAQEPFAYTEKIGYLRVFLKPNAESMAQFLAEYPAVPDKGSLATASGSAQDLSGDKYKAPLGEMQVRLKKELSENMFRNEGEKVHAAEEAAHQFIVRLSSEQLGEIFDEYLERDRSRFSAEHAIRRMALEELAARGALDWKRRQQAESESRGGDIVNFDTPGIYTGTAADYANRSRRGGVDDGPSLRKVGTGEGSQVYGWGLYGSDVRGVADNYARTNTAQRKIGKSGSRNLNEIEEIAARRIENSGATANPLESATESTREDYEYFKSIGDKKNAAREKSILDELVRNGDKYAEVSGSQIVYEQTFFTDRAPGDESHLLKWYEDLPKEQVDWIAQEFAKEGFFVASFSKLKGWTILDRTSGKKMSLWDKRESGEAYEAIAKFLGSPQAASEFLARAGIDGVKYPVDSYGGKGVKDGDVAGWNYVSFRDDNIRVDHKWVDNVLQFDTPELGGVNFDTKQLSQAEGYEASEKRQIEDDQLIGFTKEDAAHSRRVLGMVPLTHTARTDAERHMMADALLSRSGYGQKLAHAVANFGRPLFDYEQTALGKYRAQRLAAVNEAKLVADAMQTAYDALPKDAPAAESQKAFADLKAAKAELQTAMGLLDVADRADDKAGTEWGRTGRARQDTVKLPDMSWGGITRGVAQTFGGSENIPQELMPMIEEAVKEYEKADEMQKKVVAAQFEKALDKAFSAAKNGAKIRRAVEHREGEEAKRAEKNYLEALAQFQVGAEETGGTLIGLADQKAPGWGKWLRYLAEYHCFMNPDIKVDECVAKMIEDLKECGMTAVDEVQVWEAWAGYGHSFRQSRFESQRRANWLKEQALHLAQLHHMDETNTMPEATGMIRDEDPTQEGRDLKKKVYDRKKEVPDAERDERHLKSIYDTIKRQLDNRIAELKHAIETGERIPPRNRTVREDLEIRQKRKERDELQAVYDGMFGTTRTLTPEQRIAMAEKAMAKILERDLEDIARAERGDFSKIEGHPTVNDRYVKTLEANLGKARKTDSPTLQAMREKHLENVKQMLALKKAQFEYGMTPEEIAAHNAKKLANLDKRIAHYAEIFATGDLRRNVSRQPPMTPEQQKQFDEKEKQLKKAQRKLAELRLEALRATAPKWSRNLKEYGAFILAAQRALKTTIDFSSMFNQAAGMTISHPLKAIRSFGRAWSAMWSDARMAAINDEIMSDPQIQEAVNKYGLHLREVDADNGRDVDMFKGMESQTVKLFGKRVAISDIPFYGKLMLASERHYITYLNAMSAELYVHIANGLNERFPGGMTPWMKKQLCDMINIWNGSGALTKEKRMAWQEGGLSNFFFSLPLLTSQVQTIFWRDALRPLSQEGLKNEEGVAVPVTDAERKTMAKIGAFEHVKMAVATLALSALLRWIFADDDDRWQFDGANWFEKLIMAANPKIGNTTLDFTGGTATTYRLLYKIASGFFTGKVKTGSGRSVKYSSPAGPNASSLLARFLEGRAAPWISTALSILNKKNFVGEPYGAWEAAKDMFVPMSLEDSYEQIVQNGFAPSLFTIPLTIAGVRAQTYDRQPYENAVNTFLEAEREYGDYATDGNLGEADRKAVLDEMKASNPLLHDGVRDRLIVRRKGGNTGLIPNAQRAERRLKKLQADPNASKSAIAEAERLYHKTREDVMKFIRENRWKKPSGASATP